METETQVWSRGVEVLDHTVPVSQKKSKTERGIVRKYGELKEWGDVLTSQSAHTDTVSKEGSGRTHDYGRRGDDFNFGPQSR